MIAERLASELKRPNGSAMNMGQWMGFPYESAYKEKESKYLAYEIEVLTEIMAYLERDVGISGENIVVDTTGSVVYTGEPILRKLGTHTRVVHLSTPPEVQERMLKAYLDNPGPVLWRDVFSMKVGEKKEEALSRSYERLLLTREKLYQRYAHVTIDYYKRHQEGFGVDDFLAEVENQNV